jgi:hypothetical protein
MTGPTDHVRQTLPYGEVLRAALDGDALLDTTAG